MAPGAVINGGSLQKETVFIASSTEGWQTLIQAGGPATQDAAVITFPVSEIGSTKLQYNRKGGGLLVALRLKYDSGLVVTTSPVVKLFGYTSQDGKQLLKTRAGSTTSTLTVSSAEDVYSDDGAFRFTTPDMLLNVWDSFACETIVAGIQTALAGTGATSNSTIEFKIF